MSRIIAGFLVLLGLFGVATEIRKHGRFQPVPQIPNMALDTRTGKLCYSFDPIPIPGNPEPLFPLCEQVR